MILLEQISIYMFFILQMLLEAFAYWKVQMISLIGNQLDDNEIPLWGLPSSDCTSSQHLEDQTQRIMYEASEIGEEQNLFFESLYQSIEQDCPMPIDEINPFVHDVLDENHKDHDTKEVEKIGTFVEEPITAIAAHIQNHLMGMQAWTVEVVGEEQGYIHVSDGTARAWIYTAKFGQFFKGDILHLIVDREVEHIHAISIELLQRKSPDFLIYDEEFEFEKMEALSA